MIVTDTELFVSPDLALLQFCLWGWMNSEVYNRKVDTQDKSLTRISNAAARMKTREDQPGRTARDFHTRVAKSVGADGEGFRTFI